MQIAYSPQGRKIVGTLENILAVAQGEVTRERENVAPEIDYGGDTKIDWNSQVTVERDGQRVFVDAAGNECLEDQLVWREETT